MRPWAEWTAKTALAAAGFAAAGGSLSGVAQAGAVAPLGTTGGSSALIGNQVIVPVGIPASVCGVAYATQDWKPSNHAAWHGQQLHAAWHRHELHAAWHRYHLHPVLFTGAAGRGGLARVAGWSSECADWAYDSPSEGSLPAAVGVEQKPGQFPVSIFGVVGEDPPRGFARRSAWQVHDQVGILGHRSYCA
jgi:hypothetical protein